MGKTMYNFLFKGVTKSGAGVGPTPIKKAANSAVEARQAAQKTFEASKGAKTTEWKNITKKK